MGVKSKRTVIGLNEVCLLTKQRVPFILTIFDLRKPKVPREPSRLQEIFKAGL